MSLLCLGVSLDDNERTVQYPEIDGLAAGLLELGISNMG